MASRCCPSGSKAPKTTTTKPVTTLASTATAHKDACLNNQPGTCIDTNTHICVGGDVKKGFCRGGFNIVCCPTSEKAAKIAKTKSTTLMPTLVDSDACTNGQPGTCINTNTHTCVDAAVKVGFCRGAAHIRCCVSGKKVEKKTTAASATATPTPRSTEPCLANEPGTCINTNTHSCVGVAVRAGFCPGAPHIQCCGSGVKTAKASVLPLSASVPTAAPTQGKSQLLPPAPPAPPYYPFPRGNIHTRGNRWSFTVD